MKIAVIDDQTLVLDGIKMLINEYNPDLQVECFSDVQTAYDRIRDCGTDIIISDVQMPIIDGLTLCKKIKEFCDAQLIIISGFEDFNYAKTALGLGVLNYILKPIDQREFISVLENAIEQVRDHKILQNRNIENKSIIASKILYDISIGLDNTECLLKTLSSLYNGQMPDHYCLSIVSINKDPMDQHYLDYRESEVLMDSIESIVVSIIENSKNNIIFSETNLNQLLFIFPNVREECHSFMSSLLHEIEKNLQITLTVSISNTHSNYVNILTAYREAYFAWKRLSRGANGWR